MFTDVKCSMTYRVINVQKTERENERARERERDAATASVSSNPC